MLLGPNNMHQKQISMKDGMTPLCLLLLWMNGNKLFEMLKHLGNDMHTKLWELVKIILVVNEILNDWREAVIYPIPKPSEWECDLNKTCPITLLDTVYKALVKLVNQRLSAVISKKNILQGGNHAGLPGGSTFAPLRIINHIMEDANENNKEL